MRTTGRLKASFFSFGFVKTELEGGQCGTTFDSEGENAKPEHTEKTPCWPRREARQETGEKKKGKTKITLVGQS
jgi:hypothetical protein